MKESASTTITLVWTGQQKPKVAIPEGFVLQGAKPGDKDRWRLATNLALSTILPPAIVNRFFGSGSDILLCLKGNQVVGVGGLRVESKLCHINYTGVVPGFRGRGLGSALTCWSLCDAVRRGFKKVFVTTTFQPARFAAICLYYKLGFRPADTPLPKGGSWEQIFRAVGVKV